MIIRYLFALCFLAGLANESLAQVKSFKSLEATIIRGGKVFHKNLDMGTYTTTRFRRNISSFFSYRTPQFANLLKVYGIPLVKKDRRFSTDVFNFDLQAEGQIISRVEADAVFNKKENFRLFSRQDSTFFGKANVDYLAASVKLENSGEIWDMVATNLNGSRDEPQSGLIKKGDREIRFSKTDLLLPGPVTGKNPMGNLMLELQSVYAFTENGEIVAAVSFHKKERRLWLHMDLPGEERTVITSIAALLSKRRQLYR